MSKLLNFPTLKQTKNTWHVTNAAFSLLAYELAQQTQGVLCVMTPDTQTAIQLQDAIAFFNTDKKLNIAHFPDWETLPYDLFSPHADIVSQRIELLSTLPHWQTGILIIPVHALLQRFTPTDYFSQHAFKFEKGQQLDLTAFQTTLNSYGYHPVSQVTHHGEFASRGNIIDLFPSGIDAPIRIELFDNEIDSIRQFDIETQRSDTPLNSINLRPAHEYPFDEQAISDFRTRFRARFEGNPSKIAVYQDVSQGITPGGIESYLPLFFECMVSLLEYLPTTTCFMRLQGTSEGAEQFWAQAANRFEQRCGDLQRPLLSPAELFLSPDELFSTLNNHQVIQLKTPTEKQTSLLPIAPLPNLASNRTHLHPLKNCVDFIKQFNGRVLFIAESTGRQSVLQELLHQHHLTPHLSQNWADFLNTHDSLCMTVGTIHTGFILEALNLCIISEQDLFGDHVSQKRRRHHKQDLNNLIKDLSELSEGMPVVHFEHGVGRYQGLTTIDLNGQAEEFLTLQYANDAQLHVPIHDLHLISRYSGMDAKHAPLNTLGSGQWQKAKDKAAKRIRDSAAELLAIYASRAAGKGHAFSLTADYAQFANAFPFEETPDQLTAIEAVIKDMEAPHPMDRLICGDVGFGKTEVAMRAAFIAASEGKQVVILVPTTLLAQQHYQTFCDRFADSPFTLEQFSRFQTAKEQQHTLNLLASGKADIVIGTHKLLQKNIKIKNLGLLIIDEEHRFGVHQKEKLKALRCDVDILTLTATPIPRTLNLAFSGLRDLSLIATPPAKRLSIKTFVHEYSKPLIQEAISRELMRGGQVYFLHNKVETIQQMRDELATWLPMARIEVAHGQMRERQLEQTMVDFYHQRFNVLVCSTIIETGIDIPSANTIIMNRADKFGLAQLHQLRGRVGRSHHQAYAYLLVPDKRALQPDAKTRLNTIVKHDELGVGFNLASEDLEIRGAGDLLGEGQSGHAQAIGFTLYTELLASAVKAFKNGEQWSLEDITQTNSLDIYLPMSCILPETYVGDIQTRLRLYKRLSNIETSETLHEFQAELIDRFGRLPAPTKNLISQARLRIIAKILGIQRIQGTEESCKLEFGPNPKVNHAKIIELIQTQYDLYQLTGNQKLNVSIKAKNESEYFKLLFKRLSALQEGTIVQ